MRARRIAPIVVLAIVAVVATLYFANALPFARSHASNPPLAPNFTLADIYGHEFTLSKYRNSSVVVIEFTALSCSECQVVEQSLFSLYSTYNQSGHSSVQMISVFIEPQFGDTIPALKSYHAKNNITWAMAQDTPSLAVKNAYGASDIPTVIIIDKHGHAVYDVSGVQSTSRLQSTIASASAGTASAISIVVVSVFALAVVAGVSTFFSPCAFPMFPGYMSLFLGLNAKKVGTPPSSSGNYRGAVRRALSAGSVTALGMIIVFLVIGVALILAASVVGKYIPYFLVIVGVALVALGALLLTNLQYWRIVRPLQELWRRMSGRTTADPAIVTTAADGKGFYLKLFSYGMGYAAAAAGCVAPVIFSAIIAGLALGALGGITSILIYSVTAAVLMIAVTVTLAVAGEKYVNQLKAYTPLIKKLSAMALIIVGIYLLYFYYAAWIAKPT